MSHLLLAAGGILAALGAADVPRPILIQNVRLAPGPDAPVQSILLRDGKIAAIGGTDLAAPVDARTIDVQGWLALPAFLDAYSFTGCATPEPKAEQDQPPKASADVFIDMREANRKGIQPAFRAADAFAPGDALAAWREHGFGALLSAPHGQLLAGQSTLAVTRETAARDAILRPVVFDHAAFAATGPGYPGTLMGYVAQLRQFLLDAARHADVRARHAAGRPGARPPFDADFEAIQPALGGGRRVCCEAQSAKDIDRWEKLGDEHGLQIAIAGGREAYKRAATLAERHVPVLLTLDWGTEPDDPETKDKKKPSEADAPWTYELPEAARKERRRLWLEGRDCALRLAEAGVPFAFGTGKDKPKDLIERIRTLVEAGLPRDAALRALTDGAAAILGVERTLGRTAPGFDATLAVWTKDPLTDKKAKVAWLFVDGHAVEFKIKEDAKGDAKGPDDGLDASGEWELTFTQPDAPPARLQLRMEKDGSLAGTMRGSTPDGTAVETTVSGSLSGKSVKLEARVVLGGTTIEFDFAGDLEGDAWSGELGCTAAGVRTPLAFQAKREPKEDGR